MKKTLLFFACTGICALFLFGTAPVKYPTSLQVKVMDMPTPTDNPPSDPKPPITK